MNMHSPLLKRAFDINQVLHPLEQHSNEMNQNPAMDQPANIDPLLNGLNYDVRV